MIDTLGKLLESTEGNTSEDLPYNAKKGNSPVVATVTTISSIFVEGDDSGIIHVLGDRALSQQRESKLCHGVRSADLADLMISGEICCCQEPSQQQGNQ